MLPYMDRLKPFGQYWYVTITPYGKDIEPNVPDKLEVLESFKKLSDIVGAHRIGWRYDPIFINETWPVERHIKAFEYMAKTLAGYTHTAVISFIDLYEKTKHNFPEVQPVSKGDRLRFGKAAVEIGKQYGMIIRPCAEGTELARFGADCRGCMTVAMYEDALGKSLKVPRFAPAREECACYLGGDIGAYNTCGHLCRYCYANYDAETVRQNMRHHDPESPLLIGHLMPGDEVHDAVQESWISQELTLGF